MEKEIFASQQFNSDMFGYISTLIFVFFVIMHIGLASNQYDCRNMRKFGQAINKATLPQIDTDLLLGPKQFTNVK
jgi:hypothetical protein